MACVRTSCDHRCKGKCVDRTHKKKYIVDRRDAGGVRRWKTFDRRGDAERYLHQIAPQSRRRKGSNLSPNILMTEFAEKWLQKVEATLKPSTSLRYKQALDHHILPRFGSMRVLDVDQDAIEAFLLDKLREERPALRSAEPSTIPKRKFAKKTVANVHAVLRTLLQWAVSKRVLFENPAREMAKELKLTESKEVRKAKIKAMDREQRQLFLETAARVAPAWYPLFQFLASTGARLGESLALEWRHVRFDQSKIDLEQAFSEHGEGEKPGTLKTGGKRTIDMSQRLAGTLERLETTRKEQKLMYGWADEPVYTFVTKEGTRLDASNVRHAMGRVLKKADLPRHFSPHCLRHTYASLLLQQGESLKYVQKQMGHASIQITSDLYGDWLPIGNKAAVDRLDGDFLSIEGSGSKMPEMVAVGEWSSVGMTTEPLEIKRKNLVPPIRIERTTRGLGNRCSIQLSYGGAPEL
jgi:integrase